MARPLAEFLSERLQQGDDRYWQRYLYFFEIESPSFGGQRFAYPLILEPNSVVTTEQFAVALTPGLDGGLTVEENGILVREIAITGTTGQKLRLAGEAGFPQGSREEAVTFFNRVRRADPSKLLSGQKHFQFIQDGIFRMYGELKNNPATAGDTRMYFHNLKDQQSWWVVPQPNGFREIRGGRTRGFLYRYEIALWALAPAKQEERSFTRTSRPFERRERQTGITTPGAAVGGVTVESLRAERQAKALAKKAAQTLSVFEQVKSSIDEAVGGLKGFSQAVASVRSEVQGRIGDVQRLTSSVLRAASDAVRSLVGVLSIAGDVVGAVADFGQGVTDFIRSPVNKLTDVVRGFDAAIMSVYFLPTQSRDSVLAALRGCKDAFEDLFFISDRMDSQDANAIWKGYVDAIRGVGGAGLSSGVGNGAGGVAGGGFGGGGGVVTTTPLRVSEFSTTLPFVGMDELARASETLASRGVDVSAWRSVEVYEVQSGDTLETIAWKMLGDASLDYVIALFNGLSAPYVSTGGAPGTVRPGDEIVVPSTRIASGVSIPGIFAFSPSLDVEERLFGRDLLLKRDVNGLYDLVVDDSGADFATVVGVENLIQGLNTRLETELGTDVLEPDMGRYLDVGTAFSPADRALIQLRTRQAVEADPRVRSVEDVVLGETVVPALNAGQGLDVVAVELNVLPRGLGRGVGFSAAVG